MISTRPRGARRTLTALTTAVVVAAGASACGSDASGGSGAQPAADSVVTSFYPLQFATERVAGGKVPVTVLTKPGAEPHDLELAPQDVGAMTQARLVVYADGFQPAVDDAVGQVDASKVLDVADAARLTLTAAEEEGHDHAGESESDHAAHSGDDPHFWLDPERYGAVATAIAQRLGADDPANAATYSANAKAFVAELDALDQAYEKGLASCDSKVLVTSHAAFGYLAQRYGLEQHGISGLSPEAEPSAAGLKEVSDLVRTEKVSTIFQETLVEPKFAETVATSTGATLATLDPVEGITTESSGKDYFEVMRSNLSALQKGLGCR